jgi:hypothetical protein
VVTSCTKLHASRTINMKERGNKIIIFMRFTTSFTSLFRFSRNSQMLNNNNWRFSVANFYLIRARNAESTGIKSFAVWSTSLFRFSRNSQMLSNNNWRFPVANFHLIRARNAESTGIKSLLSEVLHCSGFHETPKCSATIIEGFLWRIFT